LKGLRKCSQILPEAIGIAIMEERFNFEVCTLPDWNGAGKQAPPSCRYRRQTAAAVPRVCCDLDQTPAPQRLESGCQGCSIHRE
jgi:hypothetical protein